MKRKFLATCAIFAFLTAQLFSADKIKTVSYNDLPRGAKEVISKIKSGSTDWPFVKNDNKRFGNREKKLPVDNNASYREFTVCTDGMKRDLLQGKRPNRGAKRIVYDTKNDIYYYTNDHYGTFRRVVFKDDGR